MVQWRFNLPIKRKRARLGNLLIRHARDHRARLCVRNHGWKSAAGVRGCVDVLFIGLRRRCRRSSSSVSSSSFRRGMEATKISPCGNATLAERETALVYAAETLKLKREWLKIEAKY